MSIRAPFTAIATADFSRLRNNIGSVMIGNGHTCFYKKADKTAPQRYHGTEAVRRGNA